MRGAKGAVVFDDLELPSEKAQRARLYAPCFGQEAIERIDPPLHPERVPNPAPYFEHDALISVCTQRHEEWSRVAFVGIGRQTRGAETEPDWSVLGRHVAATGGGHDAYGIGIDDYHPTVWRSLGRMETRAWDIARHLLVRRLGVPEAVLSRRAVLIQGNRWIARPRAFERYVREWLIPARTALEDRDDRALQALLAPPTRGGRFPIPPEPWKRLDPDGRVHESYHPYVLERLAPLFFVFAGYRLHLIRHA